MIDNSTETYTLDSMCESLMIQTINVRVDIDLACQTIDVLLNEFIPDQYKRSII